MTHIAKAHAAIAIDVMNSLTYAQMMTMRDITMTEQELHILRPYLHDVMMKYKSTVSVYKLDNIYTVIVKRRKAIKFESDNLHTLILKIRMNH